MLPEVVTLEYLTQMEEGQYLDRKSARIKPTDIAKHLVAFANANGGVLVIGIEDDGEITGFKYREAKSINDFLNIPFTACVGNMKLTYEERKVRVGERVDSILIFFVDPSEDTVIKTSDSKVYLRVGDKSKLLNHEQVTQLEYDKGERSFEDIVVQDSSMEDVDLALLYRNSTGYEYNADVNGALNILKKSKVVCLDALYNRGVMATPMRIRIA